MKISDIITEATIKQELPRNSKTEKSPALLTFDQWMAKINPTEKWHSSNAYNWDLEQMNQSKNTTHGKLYVSKKLRGVTIDFYGDAHKLNYAKRNEDDSWVTDETGNLVYYSDEEIRHLGMNAVGYTFTL